MIKKNLQLLQKQLAIQADSGILLFIMLIFALIAANSPFANYYQALKDSSISFRFSTIIVNQQLLLLINDGFMSLFFLLVGLEIKREILLGELSQRKKALLPMIAALGGMIFPALVYLLVNFEHPSNWQGFGIPMATDIAFSIALLSLLGTRVPVSLKVLLTALAIMDDLGAILVIAIFYGHPIHWLYLLLGAVCFITLFTLNKTRFEAKTIYILGGLILWYCIWKSGIHATLSGVLLALTIPIDAQKRSKSLLDQFERALHPWVAIFILPIFAFFNAGIAFHDFVLPDIFNPLTLGIILGLVIGKPLGIGLSCYSSIKANVCQLPRDITWPMLLGMSLICGIGFTMSLFISLLAYGDNISSQLMASKLGVLLGSGLAAGLGYVMLRFKSP